MAMPVKPKAFNSPEELWQYFIKYKQEIKSNPILIHDFVGKESKEVFRKKEKPLTVDGFNHWLANNEIIWSLKDYYENKKGNYNDYILICDRIKNAIRTDQIEGGMVGIYSNSITQRLNNLAEQTEIKHKTFSDFLKESSL